MNPQKKVLLVDDEPLARERLRRLLGELNGYLVVGEVSGGEAAIEYVGSHEVDILLLDISMPGLSGMEVARYLAHLQQAPAVIFCTAYGDYALEAFVTAAAGYVLKPVRLGDLDRALSNAVRLNRAQIREIEQATPEGERRRTHISARSHRGVELLPLEDISHFVAEDKYVFAHHNGSTTLLEESLRSLQGELDGQFLRVHRNTLVSIARIEALERSCSEARLRLSGTSEKPLVSRRLLKDVKELLTRL